jgi:hypothetical protein
MNKTELLISECLRMPLALGYLKLRDHALALEAELQYSREDRQAGAAASKLLADKLAAASAKLSERKTVHEWLNAKGTPREENGKPLCLLRRLAIALDVHGEALNESNASLSHGDESATPQAR